MSIKEFEYMRALLGESDNYYLIMVDMDSNYSYVNKHYNDVFKAIHGNLLGKHYSATMHEEDIQHCVTVANLAFGNRDKVFPATIRKHDGFGGYIVTRWDYRAIFDEHGAPLGIFCLGHDITELSKITGELDQIKLEHSHSIRAHVANILGLGRLISDANDMRDLKVAALMMLQSTSDLDDAIKRLYCNTEQ